MNPVLLKSSKNQSVGGIKVDAWSQATYSVVQNVMYFINKFYFKSLLNLNHTFSHYKLYIIYAYYNYEKTQLNWWVPQSFIIN